MTDNVGTKNADGRPATSPVWKMKYKAEEHAQQSTVGMQTASQPTSMVTFQKPWGTNSWRVTYTQMVEYENDRPPHVAVEAKYNTPTLAGQKFRLSRLRVGYSKKGRCWYVYRELQGFPLAIRPLERQPHLTVIYGLESKEDAEDRVEKYQLLNSENPADPWDEWVRKRDPWAMWRPKTATTIYTQREPKGEGTCPRTGRGDVLVASA